MQTNINYERYEEYVLNKLLMGHAVREFIKSIYLLREKNQEIIKVKLAAYKESKRDKDKDLKEKTQKLIVRQIYLFKELRGVLDSSFTESEKSAFSKAHNQLHDETVRFTTQIIEIYKQQVIALEDHNNSRYRQLFKEELRQYKHAESILDILPKSWFRKVKQWEKSSNPKDIIGNIHGTVNAMILIALIGSISDSVWNTVYKDGESILMTAGIILGGTVVLKEMNRRLKRVLKDRRIAKLEE